MENVAEFREETQTEQADAAETDGNEAIGDGQQGVYYSLLIKWCRRL